ncbi:hypothetical protein B9Z19DRAFT_1094511 [Tuber borchii]|uniref:Secreted protein n=1 Tax=Tuber borchii TaxID=42251 RepID=A0A2T6ZE09_TUBBO|nr:hypothetical protein B9Z19DRAFT_1094511 [Tuber borchii]
MIWKIWSWMLALVVSNEMPGRRFKVTCSVTPVLERGSGRRARVRIGKRRRRRVNFMFTGGGCWGYARKAVVEGERRGDIWFFNIPSASRQTSDGK